MFQLQNLQSSKRSTGYPQANLKAGYSHRNSEKEAIQAAEDVMHGNPTPEIRMSCSASEGERIQMKPMVQLQPIEEEEEMVQPKQAENAVRDEVPAAILSQINTSRHSGKVMDSQTKDAMNRSFRSDFSRVTIHSDYAAAEMNRQLHAQAFTVGNDIYFNQGEYKPSSPAGRRLLAHELTHVVQQGGALRPMIQKNGEEESASSAGTGTPLADLVAGLLRDQLSNSSMRGHLSSLGEALQELALETTAPAEGEAAEPSAERLAALGIPQAFEITSAAILSDPSFARFRERLIEIVGSSDQTALVAALAAGLALALADISVSGSPSHDFGHGISVGGSFDLGSIQSLQFNNASLYFQYARDHFRTRITGTLSRDEETEEFSGTGRGEVRVGTDVSHLLGRVTINSDGEVVLMGRLSAGHTFGGSDQLIFTTDLTHSFASGETIIQPGLSGRFSFGSDQSLRVGSSLVVSSESGVTGLTGFIEYRRDHLRLRVEGSMTGLAEETGIVPGGDMRVQGTLTIPLW